MAKSPVKTTIDKKETVLLESYSAVKAGYRESYRNIDVNTNVRQEFGRTDYDYFRPMESVPEKQKEGIRLCMAAYDKIGIIKNIIDLMGDFACKGIKITHSNPRVQSFYRHLFNNHWNGKERSERFLNLLYRAGNVVVYRKTAKLTPTDVKKMKTKGDVDIELETEKVPVREIPYEFVFLNPITIDVVGGELAQFANKKQYAVKLPSTLKHHALKKENKDLVASLPQEIRDSISKGKNNIPLKSDRISVFHYKKDDWQLWANPILYSLLDDIKVLEKLKLTDLSALDGAISNIRLWKIGSLEHGIPPTAAAAQRLSNLLTNNVGGGTIDLIWGPDIELQESNSQVYKFLGQEKYAPTLSAIYVGLGVPPALTGSSGGVGYTNNFLSLKTLVERLEYGRETLRSFWMQEIKIVANAMRNEPGFDELPDVVFDHMVLADEAAEKALLVQLADRNLISIETLHERFGEKFGLEKARTNNEAKARKSNKLPQQAGPWFNPQQDFDFKKLLLQMGSVTPSEVGLELEERKPDEETAMDKKFKQTQELQKEANKARQAQTKQSGIPSQGRPKNSKDQNGRKKRRVLPRTKASLNFKVWASDYQKKLNDAVNTAYLQSLGKKNLRQLTTDEMKEVEDIKFSYLMNTKSFAEATPKIDIASIPQVSDSFRVYYNEYLSANPNTSVDNIRSAQLAIYEEYNGESSSDG